MVSMLSRDEDQLRADQFSITYPDRRQSACQVDKLTVKAGHCLVLCGPSGSGKSSFLNAINGLVPEYYPAKLEGSLVLGATRLGELSVEELSHSVSSVFQNPATQFFHRKVVQELVFPCENQGLAREVIAERLDQVVELFQIGHLLEKDMFDLSGGQKQLVAVATAMMQGAEVMLFDEPTANLDRQGVEHICELFLRLKEQGKTLIIAEHRLAYLAEIADCYAYFRDGKVEEFFSAEAFLALSDGQRRQMGLRSADMTAYRQQVKALASSPQQEGQGLQLHQLSIWAGKDTAYSLGDRNFQAGQVVGVIGKNGAGKTSLAQTLAGLRKQGAGEIFWQGQVLSAKARLEKVAYVMQDVQQQLLCERVQKELTLGQKKVSLDQELLALFRLSDLLDCHPMSLSVGEQQRVMIVASLLRDKEILIFDEPSSGLDLEQMEQLAQQLQLLKEKGKLILLISHDEELLASVCDRIVDIEEWKEES